MKKIGFVALALLLILNIIGWLVFLNQDESSSQLAIKCVDIERIYTDFEMTKEVNARYKNETEVMISQIDSLDLILANPILKEHKENLDLIRRESRKLVNSVQQIKVDLEGQVWKRLNQYIDEFGHKNEYDLIVRSGFGENIFYTDNKLDITNETLNYINNKYLGNAN